MIELQTTTIFQKRMPHLRALFYIVKCQIQECSYRCVSKTYTVDCVDTSSQSEMLPMLGAKTLLSSLLHIDKPHIYMVNINHKLDHLL